MGEHHSQHDPETGRFVRQHQPWAPEGWDDNGFVDPRGYFRVYRPDYPRCWESGYAKRYAVVYWLAGGVLADGEVIHHKDEDQLNDRIENLSVMTHAEHISLHCKGKNAVAFTCDFCGNDFKVPRWRVTQRAKEGTQIRFCSPACFYLEPRSTEHCAAIGNGLRRAWKKRKAQ